MKYEFTLTLKPQWYQYSAPKQFQLAIHYLEDILKPYQVSCVAELTGEHNVHFHGLLELDSIVQKDTFLNRFRPASKFFGRKTCQQVQWEDSYKQYMRKDLEKTKFIISDPIVRDSYGVFKTIF